ncbi:YlxR family protein [[Mycoplasma] gypis]|uniref:YlxR family protein n=1 Tax=[Mycoplasma] gypis TaxID=92404 RepID=A0ABZ2RN23_9BACT|nr:YlxR family protein [[Mycoplasma] gypis]MBN0919585.1 YlxR family protein [[Mycoplasma] gypis]
MKKDNILRKNFIDGKIYSANKMIRFARLKNGMIVFDPLQNQGGRGAYCLDSEEHIEKCFQKKLLSRAFKTNVNQEIHNKLEKEVLEWLKNRKENQI